MRALALLLCAGCGGFVTTTSGLGAGTEALELTFFKHTADLELKAAYEQICPSLRAAIDYRAFGQAVVANPLLHYNGGLSVWRTTTVTGGGTMHASGWLVTMSGGVAAELTLARERGRICLLGGSVAGNPILPAFDAVGQKPPESGDYLAGETLRAFLSGAVFSGKTSGGAHVLLRYDADGRRTIRATLLDGHVVEDTGRWDIEQDNRVCGRYEKLNAGKSTCVRYLRVGDDQAEVYDDEGFKMSQLRRLHH